MFSPDASRIQSLRPKRTRQTSGPEDSIKLPQAKRKRSALRRDTFEPLAEASLNEIAGREAADEKTNGHLTQAVQTRELTLRGSKKPEKRSERTAGLNNAALTLASNDFYTVAQLPSLPEQIKNHPSIPYSCVISPEYGFALALTHSDAIIWPYHSSASTPSSRDVVTFKLPFPPASVDDPLPLATFTSKSASGEPGIVAVSSKWGKVVYWETISNASSLIPGQTSSVQGSIPGMTSREIVEELVNAEPSGFILSLRGGRVAHLTIRDQMGRPGIGVQFLRKYTNGAGGLFGSIRNVFGGEERKGTPLIKAGGSRKGQRDVVIATEDAELEFWNTNLSVGNSLETSFSFKDEITDALRSTFPDTPQLNFKVLDVELSAGPSTALSRQGSHGAPMMVLGSVSLDEQTKYYIIEMVVDEGAKVKVVHPISCYSSSSSEHPTWRPRLCVARTQPVAFVLFETAIVIFSLAKVKESPSTQLILERQSLPEPFQDCVRFQDATIYKVLGYVLETSEKQSSVVFGVQGFGIVKMISHLRQTEELDVDEFADRISAKSKIEQAVFFGSIKQNPFDLKNIGHSFPAEEIESAALSISSEIVSSTSKHLPKSAPSIDMHLRLRAKALGDLAQHLMKHYSTAISRDTRFQLLLNAEKVAAAQALWKVQEEIQRRYPQEGREMTYLDFTLRALHETRQKYPDPEKGEKDRVRHWLVNSVGNIDHLMSELVSCTDELGPMQVTDPKVVADYLKEAVDLWIASYSAGFKFREDNAPGYGLGDEVFQDGVLISGFPTEIPHPWTSKEEPFRFGQRLIYDMCGYLTEWWDNAQGKNKKKKMPTDLDGKPYEAPSKSALKDLAARLPVEVELFCRITKEEFIQAACHLKKLEKDPEVYRDELRNMTAEKQDRIDKALQVISTFNMLGAIQLAEKLQNCPMLVNLHYAYYSQLTVEAEADPSLKDINSRKISEMQNQAETYFERFGKQWAWASFSQMTEDDECGNLLIKGQEDDKKQQILSWFFKKAQKNGQSVGKLSWIHDVVGNGNYARAERTLQGVVAEEVVDVWNKKTELALAKLAGLAADEGKDIARKDTQRYDSDLSIVEIQERVCQHVLATIGPALDDKAANDLARENFASRLVKDTPGLKTTLKQLLKSLLHQTPLSPEELVDLLTLMDSVEWVGMPEEDPEICGQEFITALQVVDLASLPSHKQEDLRALIWRRAMIRDNWVVINDTSGKGDDAVQNEMQQTSLFRTIQQAFLLEHFQGTPVHLLSPDQLLGRESFPSSLQARFAESELDPLRKDMDKEQTKLKKFIEKGRLEDHYGGLVSSAQRSVRGIIDQQGERMAQDALAETNGH
ncbi:hypothetical protein LTR10_020110 [Elasticomyces elasticus]|uniref:Nucleoporin Nup133/Nup155-like C-terminal domain-containing protein n=1 Tax=Exophiala sideris TaxID=1016849 RepID=A0ABR0IWD3_9EURO|nr:hypothetical protein LTR10_020110 [Elasticomyces elasticus]KAK5021571.1 hypothetical protein LTS07_010868 [Exophiala sideris]KAK5024797.1 hypothetical protein LTR13_010766 [Exophiala sideris]KAK5049708.1 hypothetical protein LTR69_010892 [Exophiala sideris]KAK5176689.1 hypothetical protein LTR44_010759 [Eurotiomycetes sp. CCFEE 6388]